MAERTVTGTILNPDGTPRPGAVVRFRLVDDTFTLSPDATYDTNTIEAMTGSSGVFSISLVADLASPYEVRLPSGETFLILVPSGSATTLEALRAATSGTPSAPTVAGALPGGSVGHVQYQESSTAFGGDAGFTYDPDTDTIEVGAIETGAVASSGGVTAVGAIGYAAGAGGTVTQATNKATGVTLNKQTGAITVANVALASNTTVSFVVTNSAVSATDGIFVWIKSGGTLGAYLAWVSAVGAGSFTISLRNITAGSLTEQPVIGFLVLEGVNA